MSEFMGLVYGQYDAKPEGFRPGGMSLHNCHGAPRPGRRGLRAASHALLAPHKLDHTLAFMFESRWRFRLTEYALHGGALDKAYADCWAPLADRFAP
jgi:homogentisate 1,2-dioxygenase